MITDKICKTIHQYNAEPLPREDMQKLLEIAEDYGRIKNYVYQRYGGIKGLPKLYPGYTIQNEMTKSGLRMELGLPSVYFYLAVFDALGDIKTQWSHTKKRVMDAVKENPRFTARDRHYLRFAVKVSGCFEAILNGKEPAIPEAMQPQYESIIKDVDVENLNRYLCRQVRKKISALHTDKADGFAVSQKAYRYGSNGEKHGIFFSTKEKRKRIFVPLTDKNQYEKQLYIKLRPEDGGVEICVPMEIKVRMHKDYQNEIGLSIGIWQMFTTESGHVYGTDFGELHKELTEFISAGRRTYSREKENNPGRKKYRKQKERLTAKLETYVNQEINRMLKEEKPGVVYIPKLPQTFLRKGSCWKGCGKINYSNTIWKRGYIRERLELKCQENHIRLVYVPGKDISRECSNCGSIGVYEKGRYRCLCCGYEEDRKVNAAKNAFKRGKDENGLQAAQEKSAENLSGCGEMS